MYRQRLVCGLLPVPGREAKNPPMNHHGVDLPEIRKRIEMNRTSINDGKVMFPGLGVSKHPMTIVTSTATYVVGWARKGGIRPISIVGGPSLSEVKILFLHMGEPMVFGGPGEKVCMTPPVVFIGRRHYRGVRVRELPIGGSRWKSRRIHPGKVASGSTLLPLYQ